MKMLRRAGLLSGFLIPAALAFSFEVRLPARASGIPELLRPAEGRVVSASLPQALAAWEKTTASEIAAGSLRLLSVQSEDLNAARHMRYDQYHKGVRVWGAQIILHYRGEELYLINGTRHDGLDVDIAPVLTADQAAGFAERALPPRSRTLVGAPELVIFPAEGGARLAWLVFLSAPAEETYVFIDARSGEAVFKYDNLHTVETAQIGLGTGTFGDLKKLSTAKMDDGTYWTKDKMRPALISTATAQYAEDNDTAYYLTDEDNTWDEDPTVVDGHAYLGGTYDYYYLVHGRKGIDDKNMGHVLVVHYGSQYQNAFYLYSTKWIYFGDGKSGSQHPYAAALDIVAHEFTHGVNHHTCNQTYWGEPGALNEAFSDIMGVSCEFRLQTSGSGYGLADWWEGEDTRIPFGPSRDLTNPAGQFWSTADRLRYPDHYSKRYTPAFLDGYDNDGVHINMTIGTHWYYLLANGGTNRTSGITVPGIGLADAEKIAYRGWTVYMGPSTNFKGARAATIQAAVDIFGASSVQADRVKLAWTACGVN